MTVISVLGIGLGVTALIVVLSVMGGFESDLTGKMLSGEPHFELLNRENPGAGISLAKVNVKSLCQKIPDAENCAAFTSSEVVLKRKTFVAAANLFGIDPTDTGKKLWAFDGSFSEGRIEDLDLPNKTSSNKLTTQEELPGIALGDQLAQQIGANVGDIITVLSPQVSAGSILGGEPIARRFVLTGKFITGLFNYDGKWAVTTLEQGRYFLMDFDPSLIEEKYVTGIGVNVHAPLKLEKNIAKIELETNLKVLAWTETNKSLLFALKLEKFTMGSILMLIVLVAAFSISGTMIMMVYYKRRQVSILRAIGLSRQGVLKLFLAHGLVVGSFGVLLGLGVGLCICLLIQQFKFIPLPAGVYYLRSLPVKFLPLEYGIICSFAWILALFASIYPAFMASRHPPTLGLQYE